MVNGKSTGRTRPERKHRSMAFVYAFDKLNKSVQRCDNNALEWAMASIRSNEKTLCNGEITNDKYMDQQQKVTGLVADFMYNCNCSKKKIQ